MKKEITEYAIYFAAGIGSIWLLLFALGFEASFGTHRLMAFALFVGLVGSKYLRSMHDAHIQQFIRLSPGDKIVVTNTSWKSPKKKHVGKQYTVIHYSQTDRDVTVKADGEQKEYVFGLDEINLVKREQ